MQDWTATKRHTDSRKKRRKIETYMGELFRKNPKIKGVY